MTQPHYEVVDADGHTVGNVKQATPAQAYELLRMLLADGYNDVLSVALVSERIVVQRDIVLLAPDLAA